MGNFDFNELIEKEVQNRMQDKAEELERVKSHNKELLKKNETLSKENKTVQKLIAQLEEFQTFKPMINKDNIGALFNIFGLEQSNEPISGMHSEEMPNTFKLLWKFYPSRNVVIDMFDFFNVEYSEDIKNYRMPYDLTKDEIKLFIKNTSRAYVTNGCIFDDNTGFFYEDLRANKYRTEDVITKGDGWSSYISMPWQLILKNKFFCDDDILDMVLKEIKKSTSHSWYYFRLPKYHKLSEDILKQMTMLLPPSKLYDDHKIFLDCNKNILSQSKDAADRFYDNINDNHYSSFYYCNFPEDHQIKFIRGIKRFNDKVELIKKSTINEAKKKDLLVEFCTLEISN